MRRIAYLLAAALLLSGCGSVLTKEDLKPTAPTLTHGRLVYLADQACAADLRYDRTLKPATSPTSFVKNLRLSIKSGEHLIFVLRGLTPTPSDAAAFRRFLAAENGEDLVATHLLDSYGDMTVREFKHDVRRARILDRRVKARAEKLGMHVCAKD
jgi:uncharacterized protein YceK